MGKVARSAFNDMIDIMTPTKTGYNIKKVRGNLLYNRNKYEEFDEGFPDGILVEPSGSNEPKVKVRDLLQYCKKMGKNPIDLTDAEREQFLAFDK
jgi:hypothetical protein